MAIFTILILLICEHGRSFQLPGFSSISFCSVLKFSLYKYFTFLVRFIQDFWDYCEWNFLISFSICLSLMGPGIRELTGPFNSFQVPSLRDDAAHILSESLQTLSETDSEICFTNSQSSQATALTLPSCTKPWDFSPYSAPFPDASCTPQCKTSPWTGSLMMPNPWASPCACLTLFYSSILNLLRGALWYYLW